MKAKKTDSISPVGTFTMKVYKHGKLVKTIEEKNLVVDGGKFHLVSYLGMGSPRLISDISFGTNATAPHRLDTAITGAFTKTLAAVSYPVAGKVQFDWTLETYENNGMTIAEYGLMLDNGDLFARRTFATIVKNNTIRLTGSWSIQF